MKRLVAAWLAACVGLLLAHPASAHTVGVSRSDWVVGGRGVTAEIVFVASDLAGMDGVELARSATVRSGAGACPCASAAQTRAAEIVTVRARWECADEPWRVTVAFPVARLPEGAQHALELRWGHAVVSKVLTRGDPSVSVAPDDAPAPGLFAFVPMGVRHIATGWDHIVFLVALLFVRARARSVALTVTAFTVAHSLTLALAVTGTFVPSPRFVEPAIALSIAYVGVENLFVKNGEGRWRVTFPFGLVHGFGFAVALAELQLPRRALVGALAGFNLGVELGQLTIVVLVWPVLHRLWRVEIFDKRVAPALSVLVAAIGAAWFVARVAR